MVAGLATKYIVTEGVALQYLHTGPTTLPDVPPALAAGALFLLIHGPGGNAALWRRNVAGLAAAGHSAVALDLPGHGRSSGVLGLASVEEYADCVARFARAIRLRPAVIVGRSMGGGVALVLAALHPDLVRGIVVACAGASFPFDESLVATMRDVTRGRLPQQFTTDAFSPQAGMDVMREAWMEQVKTDPRVCHGDLVACRAFDARPLLPRIRVPTLVVAGADDRLVPVGDCEALAAAIPDARLEVLPAAGNLAPLEQCDAFNRLVAEFGERLA